MGQILLKKAGKGEQARRLDGSGCAEDASGLSRCEASFTLWGGRVHKIFLSEAVPPIRLQREPPSLGLMSQGLAQIFTELDGVIDLHDSAQAPFTKNAQLPDKIKSLQHAKIKSCMVCTYRRALWKHAGSQMTSVGTSQRMCHSQGFNPLPSKLHLDMSAP